MADTFIPPQFSKFGRRVNDLLFKKKYDFKNEFKVVNKAPNNLNVEVGGYGSSSLAGFAKINYKNATYGEAEAEAHTGGKAKVKFVANKFYKGLEVILTGTADPDTFVADVTYEREFFAGTVSVNEDAKNHVKVIASAALGYDGLSVGASGSVDASAGAAAVEDFNVGAEYSSVDYTASLVTQNDASEITGSYVAQLSGSTTVGAALSIVPSAPDAVTRNLTVGLEHRVDSATIIKGRFDTNGNFATHVEHRLKDPTVLLGMGALFKSKGGLSLNKFGLSVAVGDV